MHLLLKPKAKHEVALLPRIATTIQLLLLRLLLLLKRFLPLVSCKLMLHRLWPRTTTL